MTEVNPNNENETKSDIFPWNISNYCHFFSYQKKKVFHISVTFKIESSQFYD